MPTNYLGPGARGDLAHPEYDEAQFLAEGGGGPTPPGQTPRSLTPFVDAWLTGVHYEPGQIVTSPAGKLTKALTQHDSGVYATDLAASRWVEFAGSGGGAALKYGRFTSTANVLSSNVEDWVLAESAGATDLVWAARVGGFVLNEVGLYGVHAACQIDTGVTPIDAQGEFHLGYSGSGINLSTPIPTNPQNPQFSAAGNFLFTDPSEDSNEIYVAANFTVDPTGFVSVDYELTVVRLGDVPAGALA